MIRADDPTPRHRLARLPTYDLRPSVPGGGVEDVTVGWPDIASRLARKGMRTVAIETYPGVDVPDELVRLLGPREVVDSSAWLRPETDIRGLTRPFVGDDPVFGYLTSLRLDDLIEPSSTRRLRDRVRDGGVVRGPGASLVAPEAPVVYAGLPRWEATLRLRRGAANLGLDNGAEPYGERYKRAFFVDWRVADRHRRTLWDRIAFYLDTTDVARPKLISADAWYSALEAAARAPLRVVPYFDPAPWGGTWLQAVCGTGQDRPNLGWCFDCVPEENSLLLAFGDERVEVPSIDLVFREPRTLLGEAVHGLFGEEFPIRFDFLDTIQGGNLSLQVHPQTSYIQEAFGWPYTQDESYYLVDAEPGATCYLGVRNGVDRRAMAADLHRAQSDPSQPFDAERYVNRFGVRRHDHLLIPAGTVHCSGAGSLVLEISATPYIFTFKLWDWERLGLDGVPRPVHLDHGLANVDWTRDADYACARLVNQVRTLATGPGWVEERTGLHPAEFIETRRHWFTGPVPHPGGEGVAVLNLVEGEQAVVESPDGAFLPRAFSYAETLVVPAGAGPFTVQPLRGAGPHATVKAFVRTHA